MLAYLLRRLAFGVLVLWLVSIAVFVLFFVASDPGTTFCGKVCPPERRAVIERSLGLDRGYLEQYLDFLGNLLQGDLGRSFANDVSVNDKIAQGLPATASLALGAAVLWLLIGVSIGIMAATRPRSARDRLATVFVLTGLSLPAFVVGLILLNVLSFQLTKQGIDVFPPGGYEPLSDGVLEWARHLILPWIALAFLQAATYARLMRSSMLDVLGEDYVRTARAKGLPERTVVYKHGVRSALTPVTTQLGIDVGILLGGTVVIEKLFGLNGIGQGALQAIEDGDLPVVMGTVLVASLFIVVANIVVDVAYALLDRRVRLA